LAKVLNAHISVTSLHFASRVEKEMLTLEKSGLFDSIIAFGVDKNHSETKISDKSKIYRVGIKKFDWLKNFSYPFKYLLFAISVFKICRHWDTRFIHIHAALALPIGFLISLKHGCKIIYVPHELETERVGNSALFKLFIRIIERVFVPLCASGYTVSNEITEWYNARNFGVEFKTVYNLPSANRVSDKNNVTSLKAEFGIPKQSKLFIYQGLLSKYRNIELLLRAFSKLGIENSVVFMGFGELEQLVRSYSQNHNNIFFKEAVSPAEILAITKTADIGIHIPPVKSLSYYYSLPNKFFEYMYAGLPVVISGSVAMERILNFYKIGFFIDNLNEKSLSNTISSISNDELFLMKERLQKNRSSFEWSINEPIILGSLKSK